MQAMNKSFSSFAQWVSHWSGRTPTFALAALVVLVWAATGPLFHYSDTWQLVINTGTTIVTFLMVFLIQSTQNRDAVAVQAKLDELIRSSEARNEFAGIDKLSEDELQRLRSGK